MVSTPIKSENIQQPALPRIEEYREPKPEEIIPETYYLNAINPELPPITSRLMVLVEDWQTSAELLVDMTTNDDSVTFTLKTIREFFRGKDKTVHFLESWVPKEPF